MPRDDPGELEAGQNQWIKSRHVLLLVPDGASLTFHLHKCMLGRLVVRACLLRVSNAMIHNKTRTVLTAKQRPQQLDDDAYPLLTTFRQAMGPHPPSKSPSCSRLVARSDDTL